MTVPDATTMRAILYSRVSTGRQTEGSSLEAQEAKCRRRAEDRGYEVVAVLCDAGLSGKDMARRPELMRAVAMLKVGLADALIVASVSRLSRSMADLSVLLRDHFAPRKGRKLAAALISVDEDFDTSTPAGRAMCQLLGVFAEFERSMVSARCSDSAAHNKAAGRCVGVAPYGWRGARRTGIANSGSWSRTRRSWSMSPSPSACGRRVRRCRQSATNSTRSGTGRGSAVPLLRIRPGRCCCRPSRRLRGSRHDRGSRVRPPRGAR